ncbi:MAG: beta-lactamase family protein [Cytophagales bacterium]|nr:beta-lactamase family protein [Cytophagales bacterium]
MNGCFRPSIIDRSGLSYATAVEKEIDKAFVGNFAVAVLENGSVQFEKFQSANKPVDRNTIFQVASLSKWITAFGIMKLVDQGKLELDAPISKYLTRWKLPPSHFNNEEVTVRRLLSHTAGLTDGLGYSGFEDERSIQTIEQSLTKALDADSGRVGSVVVGIKPGSSFKYSGGGYTLLQLLVEEVTGKSFAGYMKEEIFTPLGMINTSFDWREIPSDRMCEFYNQDGTPAHHYKYTALAATSLYTSLSDLELFFQAHLKGKSGEPIGRNVISSETLRLMRKPHAQQWGADIWGLGTILFAATENFDFIIGHDGKSTPPINTAVRLNPKTGDGIIILETGSPKLATHLASEWVFWKTNQIDTLLFPSLVNGMIVKIIGGWIIWISLFIFFYMRQRRTPNDKQVMKSNYYFYSFYAESFYAATKVNRAHLKIESDQIFKHPVERNTCS